MLSIIILALLFASCGSSSIKQFPTDITSEKLSECKDTERYLLKWKPRLLLSGWTINLHCEVPDISKAPGYENIPKGSVLYGTITTEYENMKSELYINMEAPDKELVVLHELLHLVNRNIWFSKSTLVEEQQLRSLGKLIIGVDRCQI